MVDTANLGMFGAVSVTRVPVREGLELVFRPDEGGCTLMHPQVASLLAACAPFRTLDEHAAACGRVASVEGEAVAPVVDVLQALARDGWLTDWSEAVRQADGGRSERALPVETVGWVTRNRPEALERSVMSHAANFRAFGRRPTLVVMDDSESDAADATRAWLRHARMGLGLPARYAGALEKRRYACQLARASGVGLDVVTFGLCNRGPDPAGANRNALQLDSPAAGVLGLDDDTVCEWACHPDTDDRVVWDGHLDPTELWFFAGRAESRERAQSGSLDVLAQHERALGRSILTLLGPEGGGVATGIQRPPGAVCLPRSARVILTLPGVLGDSGMPTHAGLLWGARPATRDRLLSSPEGYRRALASREVLRVARRLTVTPAGQCMAAAHAFDNRAMLPPYGPAGRGEDSVFGLALHLGHPAAAVAHLPFAVLHDADERRGPLPVRSPLAELQLADVLQCALTLWPPASYLRDPASRLRAVGRHLQAVASLPAGEFCHALRQQFVVQSRLFFAALEAARAAAARPDLHEDLDRCLHETLAALAAPEAVVPIELRRMRPDLGDAIDLTRRLLALYGRLVEAWPDLRTTASALRARDTRVSVPA